MKPCSYTIQVSNDGNEFTDVETFVSGQQCFLPHAPIGQKWNDARALQEFNNYSREHAKRFKAFRFIIEK